MKGAGLLLIFLFWKIDPTKVSKINSLKSEAKKAYLAGDMKTAIRNYIILRDSLGVKEEELEMNLANSYFTTSDTTRAYQAYQPLLTSANSKIKTWANQQMGVLTNRQGKYEEALHYFKQALKAEPQNDQARFNYEMIKKKLEEQKKQQQKQDQPKDKKENQNKEQNKENKEQQKKDSEKKQDKKDNKDQPNKEQKEKEQKEKEQKEKEQKENEQKKQQQEKEQKEKQPEKKETKEDQKKPDPSLQDKLKDMKISEDKAKMILEAMKNQEVQYLQQNKRKATKPKDKGKPDW
ncbi:MAG: hypothetical protein JST69_01875 [Bacteroidetes bacterium]|nr:hypothetical protein [Bacteroidota bacterium]